MTMLPVATCARLLGIHPKTLHHWLGEAHFSLAACLLRFSGGPAPETSLSGNQNRDPAGATRPTRSGTASRARTNGRVSPRGPGILCASAGGKAHASRPARARGRASVCLCVASGASASTGGTTCSLSHACSDRIQRARNLCDHHFARRGELHLVPDSAEWFEWLATISSFRFVGQQGRFTAYRDTKHGSPTRSWRAYRTIHQHNYKCSLGVTDALTLACLEQTAATFQAYVSSL